MGNKIQLLLLFLAVLKCHGHGSLLKDVISGAHAKVHEVAGGIIGGISHALSFDQKFELHTQPLPDYGNHPHFVPEKQPDKTVIVVIEKDSHHHVHRPHYNPHQNEFDSLYNGYRPYPDGHRRPNNNEHLYNQNFNRPRPNNGYDRPFQNNHNYYGNNQNSYNNPNKYMQTLNYGNPGDGGHQYPGNNIYNNNNGNNNFRPTTGLETNTGQIFKNPTTEFSTSNTQSSTKKPDEDIPLFVPLNPEHKDDATNSAPKRETDKKEDEEEKFELDIRLKQ